MTGTSKTDTTKTDTSKTLPAIRGSSKPAKSVSSDWRGAARVGYGAILVGFLGFGGWTATAKVDSAVVASGVVSLEMSRKSVQHLEGGIVSDIFVNEGAFVEAGDVLFRLDPTQEQASLTTVRRQIDANAATEARLRAERDGAETVTFPQALLARQDDPQTAEIIADETAQFAERRRTVDGEIGILEAKASQLGAEVEGLQQEREATDEQLAILEEELVDLEGLLEKGLTRRSGVLSMRREQSRLSGTIGRLTASIAASEGAIAETKLQIAQRRQQFAEAVNEDLLAVRQRLSELREQSTVASDVFERREVRAPQSGRVQDLKVFTVGAVIRPGETLLDIVPDDAALIVQARVSPLDKDSISSGMRAEVTMPSFPTLLPAPIYGEIISVSGDRLMDEQAQYPYFLAQIRVEEDTIPDEVSEKLSPGLPADIIVPTGGRTMLDYLVTPLSRRFNKALREE